MDRILADRLRVDLADGAVRRLGGVGGAHDVAIFRDRVFALEHLHHHRPRGHEIDQLAEERAGAMHPIEGLGLIAGDAQALLRHDAQARLLDHRIDRTGPIARGRIGLDDRKGTLDRH